ncbi:MAG: hypothetical protein ACYTFT_12580, partial [Planctomycetota bacterium]
ARAFTTAVEQPVDLALPEGERIFRVRVAPEAEGLDPDERLLLEARALAGTMLNPGHLDWSRAERRDTDGDGRPETYRILEHVVRTDWTGTDLDGDGTVDRAMADIGLDGQTDYVGVRQDGRWVRSGVVDASLEMAFGLPWSRTAYEPHDVDLAVNGQVVGRLRDQIPEGSYRFPLPPSALAYGKDNEIDLRSTHLRGGHYIVASDYQVQLQLTETEVLVAARTQEEAQERAVRAQGVELSGSDLSVSSAELRLVRPDRLEKGTPVRVIAGLRSLGARRAGRVAVALLRATPGQKGVEVARTYVDAPPFGRSQEVELVWAAAPGLHQLQVVVDPDERVDDPSRKNNVAVGETLKVAGEDEPPTLEVIEPADGATWDRPEGRLRVRATDDAGVGRVEASIDGGLYQALRPTDEEGVYEAPVRATAGLHGIALRVVDSGGQATEEKRSVTSTAEGPKAELVSPKPGAEIDGDTVPVEVAAEGDAKHVAARAHGGPWQALPVEDGRAKGDVPVGFGTGDVEVAVVGEDGAQRRLKAPVRGTAQPAAPGAGAGPGAAGAPGGGAARPAAGRDRDLPTDLLDRPNEVIFEPEVDPGVEFGRPDGPADVPPPANGGPGLGGPGGEMPPSDGAVGRPYRRPAPSRGRGYVNVRRQVKDSYCTNRPKVKVKFRLPEWLRKLNLPEPGTKAFDKKLKELLQRMKDRGVDTSRLEKFRELLKNRCNRLEQADGELPGWLESMGFGGEKPKDEEGLKKWRESMAKKADAFFLRLLASGDEKLILEGMRWRAEQLGKFDEALAEHAQAAVDSIRNHQEYIEGLVEGIPVIGDGLDVIAAVTGRTLLADTQL